MAITVRLPKISNARDAMVSAALANWRTWIEWAANPIGAGLVKISKSGAGPVIRVDLPNILVVAVTTTTITNAATATAPTSGSATLYTFAGGTLAAVDTRTETVWNYHDKTIASGSTVLCAWALDAWWVVDVRSCSNLS